MSMLTQALNAKGRELEFDKPLSYNWLCAGWPRERDRENPRSGLGDLERYMGSLKCLYTTGESDALWPRVLDDAPERTNKHVHWLEFGETAPKPVAIHPGGYLVALETHCETIVYDLKSGERLHAWLLPTTVVQFSRDGRRLLTKRKGVFSLWDAERFVEIHRFTGDQRSSEGGVEVDHRFISHRGRVVAALSDYDDLLAISNSHGVFDPDRPEGLLLYSADGIYRHCLPVPEKAEIRSARFVSANRILMSYYSFQNHQRRFEQVESVDARNRWKTEPRESQLFPDTELATERVDPAHATVDWPVIEVGDIRHVTNIPRTWVQRTTNTSQVMPPRQPRKPDELPGYEYAEESRDSRRRLYRQRDGREVVVVDARGEILSKWDTKMMRNKETLSPSGKYLAISREVKRGKLAGEEGVHELTVYDAESGESLHTFTGAICASRWSGDAESGESLRTFTGIRSWYVQSMKIDPNEETILLQINNNSLELRDFSSGEKLAELANTAGGAGLQSRYSLDGRYIVTSKYPDPVIHVRDPRTLEEVQALENDLPVRWYRLAPKGGFLLAGQPYADHRDLVTKWELESGRRLWSHAGPGSLSGEFSESGRYYLTKSGWYTWALWDTASGTICCVVVHRNHVPASHFTFNEEEMTLYLNGEDGQLLWSADSGS